MPNAPFLSLLAATPAQKPSNASAALGVEGALTTPLDADGEGFSDLMLLLEAKADPLTTDQFLLPEPAVDHVEDGITPFVEGTESEPVVSVPQPVLTNASPPADIRAPVNAPVTLPGVAAAKQAGAQTPPVLPDKVAETRAYPQAALDARGAPQGEAVGFARAATPEGSALQLGNKAPTVPTVNPATESLALRTSGEGGSVPAQSTTAQLQTSVKSTPETDTNALPLATKALLPSLSAVPAPAQTASAASTGASEVAPLTQDVAPRVVEAPRNLPQGSDTPPLTAPTRDGQGRPAVSPGPEGARTAVEAAGATQPDRPPPTSRAEIPASTNGAATPTAAAGTASRPTSQAAVAAPPAGLDPLANPMPLQASEEPPTARAEPTTPQLATPAAPNRGAQAKVATVQLASTPHLAQTTAQTTAPRADPLEQEGVPATPRTETLQTSAQATHALQTAMAYAPGLAMRLAIDSDPKALSPLEFDPFALGDTAPRDARVAGGIERAAPVFSQPGLAQAVAQQIADVSARLTQGGFELALDPVELGKVKLSMSTTEAGGHFDHPGRTA